MRCELCGLEQPLARLVVSRGDPKARLMLIGEAPGSLEDEKGLPFVGRSGRLLDELLNDVGINPSKDIYITNVVKCRPPRNRRPSKAEIYSYLPWLYQQIDLIDPHIIILLGATAMESVLGLKSAISKVRGKWHFWNGRMTMPLFHPAYLLRNPSKALGAPIDLTRKDLLTICNSLNQSPEELLVMSSLDIN